MTATDLPLRASAKSTTKPKAPSGTFSRLAKYTGVKVLVLFLTVVVAVYVTILIANMGEYVDEITRSRIDGMITGSAFAMVGLSLERILEPRLRKV